MTNKAPRHRRLALKLGAALGPESRDYEILDPDHRPDMRGEFAGARVQQRGDKQIVNLNDAQARFYLDQGALKAVLDS
jgi:hypothetical protein